MQGATMLLALVLLQHLLPVADATTAVGVNGPLEGLRRLDILEQLERQLQHQEELLLLQQRNLEGMLLQKPGKERTFLDLVFQAPRRRLGSSSPLTSSEKHEKQQQPQYGSLQLQQLRLLQQQLEAQSLWPLIHASPRRRLQGVENWVWPQPDQHPPQESMSVPWLPLLPTPTWGPADASAGSPYFAGGASPFQQHGAVPYMAPPQRFKQPERVLQPRSNPSKMQQEDAEGDGLDEGTREVLEKLQKLNTTVAGRKKKGSGNSRQSRSGQLTTKDPLQQTSKALAQALEFGGALVEVILRAPDFFVALEDLARIFLPLPGASPSTEPTANPRDPILYNAGSGPNSVQSAAAAALQVVEFFAEIEKALQLAAALQQQLQEHMGGGGLQLLHLVIPQKKKHVAEDDYRMTSIFAPHRILVKPPETKRRKSHKSQGDRGLGDPLKEWMKYLQEFVNVSHACFAAAGTILEIAEGALTKLQVHRLLQGYNKLLRGGALVSLGVVSEGPPPEEAGPPTTSCAQQGMTCCVPLMAAAGWQEHPLYLNSSNRAECKASFFSRRNQLCASAAYIDSPCNILATTKETGGNTADKGSSDGSTTSGNSTVGGLVNVYTAVLPLPGYSAAAVCQCEVSIHPNEDGLHTVQGFAAWDSDGAAATDIIAETQHNWGYIKAFVRTGQELTGILEKLADPNATALQRVAQILSLVSKGGIPNPSQGLRSPTLGDQNSYQGTPEFGQSTQHRPQWSSADTPIPDTDWSVLLFLLSVALVDVAADAAAATKAPWCQVGSAIAGEAFAVLAAYCTIIMALVELPLLLLRKGSYQEQPNTPTDEGVSAGSHHRASAALWGPTGGNGSGLYS
ncbi:hypothetical protein cyc_06347 [Cyclospora cayetanensis]|uniref:Uncharacterized protein n=1 Tax=Cyclospora cayetanensis TaxID=88456 RepID=A0A1D3DAN6_9EIME|nr:hypothetical protein cyc_06347 [Cyclospora cayetanensis]